MWFNIVVFFLWRYFNWLVYANKLAILPDLQINIERAIAVITSNLWEKVIVNRIKWIYSNMHSGKDI